MPAFSQASSVEVSPWFAGPPAGEKPLWWQDLLRRQAAQVRVRGAEGGPCVGNAAHPHTRPTDLKAGN